MIQEFRAQLWEMLCRGGGDAVGLWDRVLNTGREGLSVGMAGMSPEDWVGVGQTENTRPLLGGRQQARAETQTPKATGGRVSYQGSLCGW